MDNEILQTVFVGPPNNAEELSFSFDSVKKPELARQQAKYVYLPAEYDMEIIHRPGASHQHADALRRIPYEKERDST